MSRLILMGAPGAGKGTQGQEIAKHKGVPQIATGDILRAAVKAGSELGSQAKSYMDAGELVPDAIMVDLIRNRLQEPDAAQGYILDGFPRTLAQAEALDDMLSEIGQPLDHVLHIHVDNETLVERLTGRLICADCGASYHVKFQPPAREGVCDKCGGQLYQREDDSEATVRSRLQVYEEQTAPLVGYYRDQGIYREIEGERDPGEVLQDILRIIDEDR
jgi:adenylate kinase